MSDHLPIRFVATTLNVWGDNRWPERRDALRAYIRKSRPDILCLQEFRTNVRQVLDEELATHARVEDPFPGWENEGNIYWNQQIFEQIAYGAEDVGLMLPDSLRRLFWGRLRVKGRARTLVVSTAHFSHQSTEREKVDCINPRIGEARRTLVALDQIVAPDEPVLFMGDLNDAVNPIRVLKNGGFVDSFTASGLPLRPTHPAIPTARGKLSQVIDWQLHRGPLRVMNTSVVDFFYKDLAPSDHKPVVTTYAFTTPHVQGELVRS